ncbi:hypothetical protein GQ44DRAFT_715544 [Phaeosphaeriaceae sp. PMI808]|nr:hypothetical protein GQ44DRAFT_715544 [Phaeosphaeriaceae sp. PMI808]
MQLTLAVLSALSLVASSVAAPEPRAASFTTWACNNCARDRPCAQKQHQNIPSETCFQLEANQQSLVVDYTVRSTCYVQLFGSTNCSGNGPTFPFEPARNCKPIPVNERASYKVICT